MADNEALATPTPYPLNGRFWRSQAEYLDQSLLHLVSFGQHLLLGTGLTGTLDRVNINHLADSAQLFQQSGHRKTQAGLMSS
ncbi:MAG: hypothetical protein O2960_05205 [Verrucomicrobia bacterium]|nr:hypothetical protein [Verrucomicrobiota bacterium]